MALRVGDKTTVRGVPYRVVGISSSRNLGPKFYNKGRVYLRDEHGVEVTVFCKLPASNIGNAKTYPVQDHQRQHITL